MGGVAAVRILHRRRLAEVPDDVRAQVELELAAEHEQIAGGIDAAIEIGVVDEVIEPSSTRSRLADVLREAPSSAGRHGNIPL